MLLHADIPSQEEERKNLKRLGRKLTAPGSHVVGTPMEAADPGDLHDIAEAGLPVVGIDPGALLPRLLADHFPLCRAADRACSPLHRLRPLPPVACRSGMPCCCLCAQATR